MYIDYFFTGYFYQQNSKKKLAKKYSVTRELFILTHNSSTVGLIIVKIARYFHNFCRGTFFISGN